MGYEISSTIQVGATASEWAEIKAAFSNGAVDWSACMNGPEFHDREITCTNKTSSPWYDGHMSKLSLVYPTVLFYYLSQGEDERRPTTTWFVNGKDGAQKETEIELRKAYQEAVRKAFLANGKVAEGVNHRVEIMPDGRVAADGENRFGECNIFSWRNITQVSCGNWHTVGLTKDGELVACGSNENGQCGFSLLEGDVVQISCGRYHTALLLSSGKVIVRGHIEQKASLPQSRKKETEKTKAQSLNQTGYSQTKYSSWTRIKRIVSVYDAVIGLTADDQLLIDGFCPCEENELRTLFGLAPIKLDSSKSIEEKTVPPAKKRSTDVNQPFSYKTIDDIPESFFDGVLLTDKSGKQVLNKPKKKVMEFDVNGHKLKITVGLAAKINSVWKNYSEYITGESSDDDEYYGFDTLYDPIDAAEKSETEMHGIDEDTGSYIGYSVPRDTVILTDEQIHTRAMIFLKLCILCSEESVAKCIVEAAPKKKNGTFAKNRITRIATLFCSTSSCETTELVGIAKDDTEIQLAIRDASLNHQNIEAVYSDLASTTNLFRGKPVSQDQVPPAANEPTTHPADAVLNTQVKESPVQNPEADKPKAKEENISISKMIEKPAVTKLSISFPVAEVEDSRKRLLNRTPKKTDGPNRFDLHLKCNSWVLGVVLYYYDKVWPGFANERVALLRSADEFVKIFRGDGAAGDVESELRQSYIRNGRTLHVLRSFVWTSVEYCKTNKEELADFSLEQSIQLAQFIFDRGGANYQTADKKTKRIGAGLLTKSEKDNAYNAVSYVNMVHSLHALIPVMSRIHAFLSEKHGEMSDAENTLKEILAGWCVFSLACYTEFNIEAGPEDYILEKNSKKPVDVGELRIVSEHFFIDPNNACVAYTGTGDTIDFPEGIERVNIPEEYIHISGSREYWNHKGTIIYPSTVSSRKYGYTTFPEEKYPFNASSIVYKGNITEIHSQFITSSNPIHTETIAFLGTGDRIAKYAFSFSYPELSSVVLPENLSAIEEGAFSYIPKLKKIRIPPNVRVIGKDAFKRSSKDYPLVLIVDKGSPAEAVVEQFVVGRNDLSCRVVLSAAEQKRIDEENRLKQIAASLQQKLMMAYHDNLDASRLDSLKRSIAADVAVTCDKQTWAELCRRRITVLPTAYLKDTAAKVSSAPSPEEAYEQLPEWAAAEYINTAEEKRARQAFERMIRDVDALTKKPILADFENGVEKNEILGQIISEAKAAIKDSALLSRGLSMYDGNATLETLRLTLDRRRFDSIGSLIEAVAEKKSDEFDRLAALLAKKKADMDDIQHEKDALEEERSHLGFFQGKRKKEIAALLEQIPERIKQIEDSYEKAKKQV